MKTPYSVSLLAGFALLMLLMRLSGEPWAYAIRFALGATAFMVLFDWLLSKWKKK